VLGPDKYGSCHGKHGVAVLLRCIPYILGQYGLRVYGSPVSHATRIYKNQILLGAPSQQKVSGRNFSLWAEHADFCLSRPLKNRRAQESGEKNLVFAI